MTNSQTASSDADADGWKWLHNQYPQTLDKQELQNQTGNTSVINTNTNATERFLKYYTCKHGTQSELNNSLQIKSCLTALTQACYSSYIKIKDKNNPVQWKIIISSSLQCETYSTLPPILDA